MLEPTSSIQHSSSNCTAGSPAESHPECSKGAVLECVFAVRGSKTSSHFHLGQHEAACTLRQHGIAPLQLSISAGQLVLTTPVRLLPVRDLSVPGCLPPEKKKLFALGSALACPPGAGTAGKGLRQVEAAVDQNCEGTKSWPRLLDSAERRRAGLFSL